MKKLSIVLLPLILGGCNSDNNDIPDTIETISVTSDFNEGEQGWEAAFSDFPPATPDIDKYHMDSGIRTLSTDDSKKGFYITALNRSDDVFMFLKKQITDVEPNQRYLLEGSIEFFSNAGSDCFGVGGSPGDSVWVKTGATELEPAQADYHMNIDIGDQNISGNDSVLIGTIAAPGIGCDEFEPIGEKTIEFSAEEGFEFISSEDGDVWLYFGTDSGYEGVTKIIYTKVSFTLTPQ